MNQAELNARYNSTKAELNKISNTDEQFLYATLTKYIPKIGYIHQLSFEQLLEAKKFLNDLNAGSNTKEMEELGITAAEVKEAVTDKFQGVRLAVWEADLKTRIIELRLQNRISNLTHDLGILARNLDKDAIRSNDLAGLSKEVIAE
jgi:Cu/Ag efflux pump CusA